MRLLRFGDLTIDSHKIVSVARDDCHDAKPGRVLVPGTESTLDNGDAHSVPLDYKVVLKLWITGQQAPRQVVDLTDQLAEKVDAP